MDLSPQAEPTELTKAQKDALNKIAEAEKEYLKVIKEIANNLLVNTDSFKRAKDLIVLATMLYRRGVCNPNEQ